MADGNTIAFENQRRGVIPYCSQPDGWDVLQPPSAQRFLRHTGVAGALPTWAQVALTDILTSGATAGDLIVYQSGAWARYALAVPAANVRNVLGVDNGETLPTWKTVLDGTAPTTSAVADAAAAGTSLVFAHRDHTHGREAFGAVGNSALGDAAANGTAVTVSHSDHKHGRESALATSALTHSGARVRRTTTQSATNITNTAVSWSGTDGYDTDSYWSGTNPTRLTIPSTGYYQIVFGLSWAANNAGARDIFFRLNGVATHLGDSIIQAVTVALTGTAQQVVYEDHFTAADYLECFAFQSSGGNLNIDTALSGTWAAIKRLGV